MKRWNVCLLAGLLAVATLGCIRESTLQEPVVQETVISEPDTLRIGISPDYAPFAFLDEDENGESVYAGADIELGYYIAERLDIEPEFVQMEFEDCLDAVEEGSVDLVLLGMLPTDEREARMDFTDVYYQPGTQVLLVRKEQQAEYIDLNAFSGKTIAARYGTLQAQLVTEQMPESFMELTETIEQSIILLRSGQVDAVALDEQVAEDILADYSDLACAKVLLEYEGQPIVGGVKKGESKLLQSVNEILKTVREEKLYLKWLDQEFREAACL